MAASFWLKWPRLPRLEVDYKTPGNPAPKIHAAAAAALERRERTVAQTVWAKELLAQEHGRVFDDLWDALNASTNKLATAAEFSFDELILGARQSADHLPHQIEVFRSSGTGRRLTGESWRPFIEQFTVAGWRLTQTEFRHRAFDPPTNSLPPKSRFYFSAHLTNAITPVRAVVEGDLIVEWRAAGSNSPPKVARIDASRLQITSRPAPPAFVPVLQDAFDAPDLSSRIEPLIVYDLDADGFPEIILPALNRLYRRAGDAYRQELLYPKQRLQIWNGLFADFDCDGAADFLFVNSKGIFLLKGGSGGKFDLPPKSVCAELADLKGEPSITCGDVDHDSDLDLFVGQYRGPFLDGNMPTPYYDANDGFPSYLLLNDGNGIFKDATLEAGLEKKQFRRAYAASFVDLNADGALDLVVTSDFAGVDVYKNDGRGHFADVTSNWLPEFRAFGMAHCFGDFNNDGALDFFVAGMTSPTAERLEHLSLNRSFSKFDPSMRAKMIHGSRLYLAGASGFHEVAAERNVARTGWSWGTSAADFDNDGWLDLYAANGMESNTTVRDYESEFWLHDIYVGDSKGGDTLQTYFAVKGASTRGKGMSYGGYEKNRLYLNQRGGDFIDAAHLLGVAFEADCRNLVTTDLDGDGKVDLVMTSVEVVPPYKQRLLVLRNELPDTGNWIGFRFVQEPGLAPPIGVTVRLVAGGQTRIQTVVTGDSFRSQGPPVIRFGLGQMDSVDSAEIKWPGGESLLIARPEINRVNSVEKPTH